MVNITCIATKNHRFVVIVPLEVCDASRKLNSAERIIFLDIASSIDVEEEYITGRRGSDESFKVFRVLGTNNCIGVSLESLKDDKSVSTYVKNPNQAVVESGSYYSSLVAFSKGHVLEAGTLSRVLSFVSNALAHVVPNFD